jgi:hypothetical protein
MRHHISLFFRTILGLTVLLAPLTAKAAETNISWDEKLYNPHPATDDLILPLPCGGAMAFRPIAVAVETIMNDSKIQIGSSDPTYGYSEGLRTVYLSAPFSDAADPNRRLFYLAKYELTQDQAAALLGTCPAKPSMKGRLPALDINWINAVDLADRYSRWMLINAQSALPTEDGMFGNLRLPSEEEWEYAARGGLKVSASEFVEPLFPIEGDVNDYVWFGSTGSANGKPRPVGLKKPNPLGLYDVIGNADEVVQTSFHLVHLDRLQGMVGGYTVKGGSYLTPQGSLRSSYRQEVSHYDATGPRTVPTVGVRFAIGVPVLTSQEKLTQIEKAWERLPRSVSDDDAATKSPDAVQDDPLKELDVLSKAVAQPEVRNRLQALSAVFKANIEGLNEQRNLAARSLLKQGALYEQSLTSDSALIKRIQQSIEVLQKSGASSETLKSAFSGQEKRVAVLEQNIRVYADLIVSVSDAFDFTLLQDQQKVLNTEFREKSFTGMIDFLGGFIASVGSYRDIGRIDLEKLKSRFGI